MCLPFIATHGAPWNGCWGGGWGFCQLVCATFGVGRPEGPADPPRQRRDNAAARPAKTEAGRPFSSIFRRFFVDFRSTGSEGRVGQPQRARGSGAGPPRGGAGGDGAGRTPRPPARPVAPPPAGSRSPAPFARGRGAPWLSAIGRRGRTQARAGAGAGAGAGARAAGPGRERGPGRGEAPDGAPDPARAAGGTNKPTGAWSWLVEVVLACANRGTSPRDGEPGRGGAGTGGRGRGDGPEDAEGRFREGPERRAPNRSRARRVVPESLPLLVEIGPSRALDRSH